MKWWHGWGPLVVGPATVLLLAPSDWPRWAVMWLLAFVIYAGCKWLTWRRTPLKGVPLWRHLGYLFAWPGLDAPGFLGLSQRKQSPFSSAAHVGKSESLATKKATVPGPPKPAAAEWGFAVGKLAAGLGVLFGLTRCIPAEYPYLAGWVGMVGVVLVLHFGTFHLLSCAWRTVGVDAKPLMDWPLASVSLGEFWGRRWNRAFRDLTHRFLFRPLAPRLGPRGALVAGFVVSGLVHDVVVSLPAGGGYGGPTLFFLIQAVGMLVERSRAGRALGLGRGWRGWLFTMALLAAPAVLLFHPPFVVEVVLPFLQAIRAI